MLSPLSANSQWRPSVSSLVDNISRCFINKFSYQLFLPSANQQRHQHDRSSWSYPVYFSPNILKYYVLVHDTYSDVEDSKAQEMFTMVQNAFDSSSCCFLPLNSRAPDSESSNASIAEHWFAFSHRWCSVEARRGKSFTSGMSTSPLASTTATTPPSPSLPHPLATPSDSPDHVVTGPKLTQVR